MAERHEVSGRRSPSGPSPNLQSEAWALAAPTRYQIFCYIAEASEPVGVAELTSYMRLNHNAVRQHLAILVETDLVLDEIEAARPGARGRPRRLYRLHPEAAGLWGTAGPYEYLAGLLVTALEAGVSPREIGQDAGRRASSQFGSDVDPVDALEHEMVRRGFRPRRRSRGSDVSFVLGRCPFADVAASNPTICQLHLGLAEGLAEGLGGLEVKGLVVENPHRAGCRVAVSPRLVRRGSSL